MPHPVGGTNLVHVDPSKPTEGELNQSTAIPRSRQGADADEALVGEIIDKGVPLGRPVVDAEPKNPPRKPGKLRMAFVVMLSVSALVCVGGALVGYVLYHNATQPNRTTPSVSTLGYINAVFSDRDTLEAARYTCGDPASIIEIQALLDDIKGKEVKASVHIDVRAERIEQQVDGENATVQSELRVTVSGDDTQEQIQHWKFTLADRSGWKVCDARKIG
jgi:hypothetical protein